MLKGAWKCNDYPDGDKIVLAAASPGLPTHLKPGRKAATSFQQEDGDKDILSWPRVQVKKYERVHFMAARCNDGTA
jgi:hypothetical protein